MADHYPACPSCPLVSLEGVWFSYDSGSVLEEVNIAIAPRESVCIIGPNGGGKTTLVRLMLGILQPDRGTVRVLGRSPQEVRRRIGYMPQHVRFDPQFPMTALEATLMGRLGREGLAGFFGWYRRADRAAARDALAAVGMANLADRPFAALSGGQRQRVLIARALCGEPDLLLLDEPTANVDTVLEAQLFAKLHELNKRMAIVVVSHDLGFVSNLAEKVICVNRRAVMHPTSELGSDDIREMYGGHVCRVDHCEAVSHEGHSHE